MCHTIYRKKEVCKYQITKMAITAFQHTPEARYLKQEMQGTTG